MSDTMQRIALASRPTGAPSAENFRLEDIAMPTPGEGEVLVKVTYMSLDPYMRGRMDDGPSYATPVPIGGTMEALAVGEVIASNVDSVPVGATVFGPFGWASHAVAPGAAVRIFDPAQVPPTAALGVLGMPGLTGWYGLTHIGKPKDGETLVVAAATGPVGSIVGQLGRLAGMRTVGIAGGAEKCRMATEELGFDACLDHRAYDDARSLRQDLAEAAPGGIDVYFENVGGKVLEAVIPLMNPHGRIPLCGMISWYNTGGLRADGTAGPDIGLTVPALWRNLLVKFITVQGFIISNHWDLMPQFLTDVAPKVLSGEIRYIEDVAEGLENAPAAFMSMLEGGNRGKQLVKLA